MLERQILHQLMEVYNYLHCVQQEPDRRIRGIWDEFLHMELTHLQLWAEMMKKYEGRDPAELFGTTLTVDFQFTENKEYIRRTLERQRDVRELPLPLDGGENWAMTDLAPEGLAVVRTRKPSTRTASRLRRSSIGSSASPADRWPAAASVEPVSSRCSPSLRHGLGGPPCSTP